MAAKTLPIMSKVMVQDMVANIKHVNEKTPIAVTSFVFDKDFNQAPLLGNQLAESFIHELHTFGIPVVDFKTTDYIRVTPEGISYLVETSLSYQTTTHFYMCWVVPWLTIKVV